jgi:molecular chaperone DnaK (HSP70)
MGSRVIGIDLGTSASLVAVMHGSEPRLIADQQGRTVMPSLVVITEDRSIKVGHDAESEARKYSDKNLLIASLNRKRHFVSNPPILSSRFNSTPAKQLHRIVFPPEFSYVFLFQPADLRF